LAPDISADSLLLDQQGVLVLGPVALIERGTELVEPPLAALLPVASGHVLRDDAPIRQPMEIDILPEQRIFLGPPFRLSERNSNGRKRRNRKQRIGKKSRHGEDGLSEMI
jgi:hypothetical protein